MDNSSDNWFPKSYFFFNIDNIFESLVVFFVLQFSCQATTVTFSILTFLNNNCFFPTCLRSVIPAILEFHICISNFNNPLATCAISSTYQCSQRLGNFFSLAKVCNARAPYHYWWGGAAKFGTKTIPYMFS